MLAIDINVHPRDMMNLLNKMNVLLKKDAHVLVTVKFPFRGYVKYEIACINICSCYLYCIDSTIPPL